MKVTLLCDICGMPAGSTCSLCGKKVCRRHYNRKTGVCSSCMHGRRFAKR